ncbi:MAG: formimidoylglutamase [Flavobacteriales bacterium]|nr:formimidoylglutamase [Flavobacteriales bacterium]
MSLEDFFQPIEMELTEDQHGETRLHQKIEIHTPTHFPELKGAQVAIFGVREDRRSDHNQGCTTPQRIRNYLYALHQFDMPLPVVDLGDMAPGHTVEDTDYAVKTVCQELMKKNIIPLVLGGSQDITYSMYTAYEAMEQTVNLVTVDQRLDFGEAGDSFTSTNYLNKIVLHSPNYLFNFSNIGHQRYFVDSELIELMDKMYFDLYRLGDVNGNIGISEPVIRNADIMSFDLSSIRASDASGTLQSGPNGLYGEYACQMCRYAGMSDKLSSFGIFEYHPEADPRGFTAHLVAQMIWCFLEGVTLRKGEFPIGSKEDYTKYIVDLSTSEHQLVFYKSSRSDRWWMDIPYPAGQKNKYERHHLVPCTYEDYLQASNDDMPDKWWKTYQKLT